jgi:hypothetical protein
MDFDDLAKPSLTEPGVKYFLHQTLKQCHIARDKFNWVPAYFRINSTLQI